MKGLILKALGGTGLLVFAGCYGTDCSYSDLVDPCYPQRYEALSRQEVNEAMAPQMYNGHVLDQTLWDEHFEAGTDKLTPGGQEHLKYIARRRPHADPVVFLQAAQDVPYDQARPDAYTRARADLTEKRTRAIEAFLSAYTASAPQGFRVVVHDPGAVGQSSVGVARSVLLMHQSYQGALPTGGGAGASRRRRRARPVRSRVRALAAGSLSGGSPVRRPAAQHQKDAHHDGTTRKRSPAAAPYHNPGRNPRRWPGCSRLRGRARSPALRCFQELLVPHRKRDGQPAAHAPGRHGRHVPGHLHHPVEEIVRGPAEVWRLPPDHALPTMLAATKQQINVLDWDGRGCRKRRLPPKRCNRPA